MSKFLLSVALVLLMMAKAHAMDIETYDKQAKSAPNSVVSQRVNVYLLGLGEGLKLANISLTSRGDQALFCPPGGLNLFADDYRRMIDRALSGSRVAFSSQQLSIEQVLLNALQGLYPCPARPVPTP